MKDIQTLTMELPKCFVESPDDAGVSWVVDKDERYVGHIHWAMGWYQVHRNTDTTSWGCDYRIPMRSLQDIAIDLCNCFVEAPDQSRKSQIKDKGGRSVAHIDWETANVVLDESYKHIDKLIDRIGQDRITKLD